MYDGQYFIKNDSNEFVMLDNNSWDTSLMAKPGVGHNPGIVFRSLTSGSRPDWLSDS